MRLSMMPKMKKFSDSDSFSSEHQAPLGLTHVQDWKR